MSRLSNAARWRRCFMILVPILGVAAPALAKGTVPPSQLLYPTTALANGKYGTSIAIHDEWMVVGANEQESASGKGRATLYRRVNGSWVVWHHLEADTGVPSSLAAIDGFGWHVAITADLLLVSANRGGTSPLADEGVVFVYRRSGTTWSHKVTIAPTTTSANASPLPLEFGHWCDVFAGTIVAGSPHEVLPSGQLGAAYVYDYDFTTDTVGSPTQLDAFLPAGCATDCYLTGGFGGMLSIDHDVIAVTSPASLAPGASCCGGGSTGSAVIPSVGAVYLFRRRGSTWTDEQRLTPNAADWTDYLGFGCDVTVRGDLLFVPIPGANGGDGRVDVYSHDATSGSWSLVPSLTLVAPNLAVGEHAGVRFAADATGIRVIVGTEISGTCGTTTARAVAAHRDTQGTASYADDTWSCITAIDSPFPTGAFGVDVAIDGGASDGELYAVGARCDAGRSPGVAGSGAVATYDSTADCPCGCPSNVVTVGPGCAGAQSVPSLTLLGPPVPGVANVLRLTNSGTQSTLGWILAGGQPLPATGCTLYLVPALVLDPPLSLTGASADLPLPAALTTGLCGLSILLQGAVADSAAPSGIAWSPRLEVTFGI